MRPRPPNRPPRRDLRAVPPVPVWCMVSGLVLAWVLASAASAAPLRLLEKDPGTKVPIAVKAFLAPATVRANEFARVQIDVTIGAPWYIFALRPDPGGGPPSRMRLERNLLEPTGRFQEDRAQEQPDLEMGSSIRVHRGRASFWTDVHVPKRAEPGPLVIRGTFAYAACNGKVCLPLRTAAFRIDTEIEAKESRQQPSRSHSDEAPPETSR